MSRAPMYALSVLAAGAAIVSPAHGQAVISTRSGVVHYFEGAVYVAGQPLEARLGRFATVPEGAELRTEQGRAEVLLTPGVFLRLSEKSAIRMIASALADTRVELTAGSAIVDAVEPAAGTSVTLVYQGWNIRQPGKGAYRIDCDPPRVWVREGQAEVAATGGVPVPVERGMDLPLAAVLVPEKYDIEPHDSLSDWADGRAQSISADNAIAANIEDPAMLSGSSSFPIDSFTYFPMLGFPSYGYGAGLSNVYGTLGAYPPGMYGAVAPYQLGFYSIYLPGYTRPPLLLGLPGGRLPVYGAPVGGIGVSRYPLGGSPIGRPLAPRPVTVTRPATPVPHGAMHVGGAHR